MSTFAKLLDYGFGMNKREGQPHETDNWNQVALSRSEGESRVGSRDRARPDAALYQGSEAEGSQVRLENRLELIRIFGGDGRT